jgi:hypothetical protein
MAPVSLLAGGLLLMRQPGLGVFLRAFHFSLLIVMRSVLTRHGGTPNPNFAAWPRSIV